VKVDEIWTRIEDNMDGKIAFIEWSETYQEDIVGVVDTWDYVNGEWDPSAVHILRPQFLKEHVKKPLT
jgi:hypothetical protein